MCRGSSDVLMLSGCYPEGHERDWDKVCRKTFQPFNKLKEFCGDIDICVMSMQKNLGNHTWEFLPISK